MNGSAAGLVAGTTDNMTQGSNDMHPPEGKATAEKPDRKRPKPTIGLSPPLGSRNPAGPITESHHQEGGCWGSTSPHAHVPTVRIIAHHAHAGQAAHPHADALRRLDARPHADAKIRTEGDPHGLGMRPAVEQLAQVLLVLPAGSRVAAPARTVRSRHRRMQRSVVAAPVRSASSTVPGRG